MRLSIRKLREELLRGRWPLELANIALSLLLVAGITGLIGIALHFYKIDHVNILYLIPVLVAALHWGVVPAVVQMACMGHERRPRQRAATSQLPLCPVNDRGRVAVQYVAKGHVWTAPGWQEHWSISRSRCSRAAIFHPSWPGRRAAPRPGHERLPALGRRATCRQAPCNPASCARAGPLHGRRPASSRASG
jgi:hypothetical protein